MKLPILSSLFKKEPPKEYFLAFLLRDEHVHAVVFEEVSGKIQVIGQGKADLPASLESLSQESLLTAADRAISIAEQSLPEGVQTHKTVFGVKESWVEDSHITKEYLGRLKQMSQELELQPIGFLVFPEAIAHLLQKEEGAPVSGILVDVGKKQVSLTLLRAGRIIETKEIPLSDSLTQTVETGLKQFEGVEIFPSRLILFDNGDKKVESAFISHHWSKTLPFLHVPQVSTLSSDFDTRAILFGTAVQMGFDAIDMVKAPPEIKGTKEQEEPKVWEKKEENEETPEDKEDYEMLEENEPSAEEVPDESSQEYFGFVRDEDIAKTETPHIAHRTSDSFEEIPEEVKEEEEDHATLGFSVSGPAFVEGAKKTLARIKRGLPKNFSFLKDTSSLLAPITSAFPSGGNKLLFLIPGAIILFVLLLILYVFSVHATVSLSLTPKVTEKSQSVTFSTTSETDTSAGTIAASVVSVTEDGKVSANATGSKDVGDKAKGSVTIVSTLTSSTKLAKGTTITYNDLKYTLDNDTQIASSSGLAGDSVTVSGVSVTASDIGSNYNLPSGTKFSVGNYSKSDMIAKNDNAFSGGSKKTITIVSQKDLDGLTTQLTDSLSDKAKQDLAQQGNSDTVILPDFTKTTVTKNSFDKKAGDEASSVTLSGTVSYQSLSYKKSDIEAYAKSAMKDQLSQDMSLAPNGITYDVKDLTVKDGSAKATLDMKASMLPHVDTKTLASQIAGKSFAQAKEILSATPQFSDASFKLSPNLFFLPQILPRLSGNIVINPSANE